MTQLWKSPPAKRDNPAKKSKSEVRRTDTIKRDKAITKPARKKMAKHTAAKARNSSSGELVYFEVDEDGTITSPDFEEPKINSDIYNVCVERLIETADIIDEIEQGDPKWHALVWHFRHLANQEHDNLIRRIELQDYHDDKELQRMRCLAKALEDDDDGWKKWITIEGDEGVSGFEKLIVDWLAAPIEWDEDMPDNATAVGSAKHFFEQEDSASLNKLDVWILEGTRPGSNYCAAMLGENLADAVNPEHALEQKIKEANEVAQKLRLSYRFRERKRSSEKESD